MLVYTWLQLAVCPHCVAPVTGSLKGWSSWGAAITMLPLPSTCKHYRSACAHLAFMYSRYAVLDVSFSATVMLIFWRASATGSVAWPITAPAPWGASGRHEEQG